MSRIKIEITGVGSNPYEIGALLLGLAKELIRYRYELPENMHGSRISDEAGIAFGITEVDDEDE